MSKEDKIDYRSSTQIAKVFHLSARRIQQLAADGILETEETPRGRRYDFEKNVGLYIDYLSEKANAKEKKKTDEENESAKLEADARLKTAKAKIAELELKELQGIMHRAEDVEILTTNIVLTMRSMLLALPSRVAVDAHNAETESEVSEVIKKEVHAILSHMADLKYDKAEYKKLVRERAGWSEEDEM